MELANLVIWGHRRAFVQTPDRVLDLSWYFSGLVGPDKKELFNTFPTGREKRIGYLSGLSERELKLMIIRLAYGLLGNSEFLLPSELLAGASLRYLGPWVDTWTAKRAGEEIWQVANPPRPLIRAIILGVPSAYLRGKAAEYRKQESQRRNGDLVTVTTTLRGLGPKEEPVILIPPSSGTGRYRREKKRKGTSLREIYAAAYRKRIEQENRFTDDECFYILRPERCYVQTKEIPAKVKAPNSKEAQGQREL